MFVLDTNVLSEFTKQIPDPIIMGWVAARSPTELAIPFGALVELQRGVELLRRTNPARAHQLSRWVDDLLETDMPFLKADAAVARLYGEMNVVPELRHLWVLHRPSQRRGPGQDLLIAAAAIVHAAVVATVDVLDFLTINKYFRLPGLFNPRSQAWEIRPRTRTNGCAAPSAIQSGDNLVGGTLVKNGSPETNTSGDSRYASRLWQLPPNSSTFGFEGRMGARSRLPCT
ncbi:type II toxin-antitoxin system VapC family toxin [Allomesorhizobium camelthorni]|uniref:Type II toxin-antitoxin system VapC family toxin n=1 Tax=Allomesorhizobium camelthorni TaxID=475069 RepID=A0A6G4W775_9HYPH|nr:type II toxin-antitoxin system VapC family toxin [Mesorhizobium camelthorni]NGO50602.1 type II toxin-antitoxin system VapC family toxin [Mesorhizobium camelthorni]